ncbi:MAG: hypothetical protein WB245_11545 [Acidimicrobiia bacterium]
MLEAVVAATAMTGLFALARGIKGNHHYRVDPQLVMASRDERGDDLPCPWCYGPTSEEDSRCSGCGRSFG